MSGRASPKTPFVGRHAARSPFVGGPFEEDRLGVAGGPFLLLVDASSKVLIADSSGRVLLAGVTAGYIPTYYIYGF